MSSHNEGPALNTDREIWRERPGDYYADSIHVTASGSIGIDCGGMVYTLPVREWHRLASSTSAGVTEEQVEATAKIIAFAGRTMKDQSRDAEDFWSHTGEDSRLVYRRMARAALEASRSPVSQKEAVPVGKYCTCANSVTSDPCIVCGKPKFITREWFERRAAAEGDLEIGVGSPVPAPVSQEEAVARDEDNMPERIWAGDFNASGFGHCVVGPQGGLYAEYVRADLAAPAGEPAVKALEVLRRALKPFAEIAAEYSDNEDDNHQVWKDFDAIGSSLPLRHFRAARSALHPSPTPVSAPVGESGPVPTHECDFSIGQPVHMAPLYAEMDPALVFYVTGISWEYRRVSARGWNITVASKEDIEKGWGQTDGFTPDDLRPARSPAVEGE